MDLNLRCPPPSQRRSRWSQVPNANARLWADRGRKTPHRGVFLCSPYNPKYATFGGSWRGRMTASSARPSKAEKTERTNDSLGFSWSECNIRRRRNNTWYATAYTSLGGGPNGLELALPAAVAEALRGGRRLPTRTPGFGRIAAGKRRTVAFSFAHPTTPSVPPLVAHLAR